ncbi:hypothetical protein L6R53_32460 [Myxococcota bacterium]|jgi:hypothetical protein|nr:hypothetical protein [Myxococcota bacterium]
MNITVALAFSEWEAVSLLNWLAGVNARILLENPELPGLYESGVVYKRETEETWSDYINLLAQGWEDCDSLAAARAGELRARGWRALKKGDGGFDEARRRRLQHVEAEVFLRTRSRPDQPGLYHCLVRYRVGSRWHLDDPSARLGMLDQRLTGPEVAQRLALQVRPDRDRPARRRST